MDWLSLIAAYANSPAGKGQREPSRRTVKARSDRLLNWVAWRTAGGAPAPEELRLYRAALAERGWALATQREYLITLLAFCRWAHRRGHLAADPTIDATVPVAPRYEVSILSDDEIRRLWLAGNLRQRVIVALLLDTAVRCDELCRMRWDDLQANDQAVRVIGKGAKPRNVFLSDLTRELLGIWKGAHGSAVAERVLNCSASAVRRELRALERLSGVADLYPHRFRHTSLTLHATKARNLDAVRVMAGHSQLTTTQRYLHADRAAVEQLHREAGVVTGVLSPAVHSVAGYSGELLQGRAQA